MAEKSKGKGGQKEINSDMRGKSRGVKLGRN